MDTRLASILLAFTFLFEFISSESVESSATAMCARYKCDSGLAQCGVMVSDETYGKNVTLNGCVNSTGYQCLFTEAMVIANTNLNVTCTEKPTTTRRR
jgi:hypothetical protein